MINRLERAIFSIASIAAVETVLSAPQLSLRAGTSLTLAESSARCPDWTIGLVKKKSFLNWHLALRRSRSCQTPRVAVSLHGEVQMIKGDLHIGTGAKVLGNITILRDPCIDARKSRPLSYRALF
jgi:hypothetical protein